MLLLLIRKPTLICVVKALFIKLPFTTTSNRSGFPLNEFAPLENFRKRFRPRQELRTKRRVVCRSDGEQRQIRRKSGAGPNFHYLSFVFIINVRQVWQWVVVCCKYSQVSIGTRREVFRNDSESRKIRRHVISGVWPIHSFVSFLEIS